MPTRSPRLFVALFLLLGCPLPGRTQPPVVARLGEPRAEEVKTESLAFSPDGRTLAALDAKGAIRLWDIANRKERATLRDAKEPFLRLAFSPDGKTIAAATERTI